MKASNPALLKQQGFINGEWTSAISNETFAVTNPSNMTHIADVPNMGPAETSAAIDAANNALPHWRALTAKERASILRNWYELLIEHQNDLAHREQLSPLMDSARLLIDGRGTISLLYVSIILVHGASAPHLGGSNYADHEKQARATLQRVVRHADRSVFVIRR